MGCPGESPGNSHDETGYRAVTCPTAAASELVGTYVHVITDDVPGAADARELRRS